MILNLTAGCFSTRFQIVGINKNSSCTVLNITNSSCTTWNIKNSSCTMLNIKNSEYRAIVFFSLWRNFTLKHTGRVRVNEYLHLFKQICLLNVPKYKHEIRKSVCTTRSYYSTTTAFPKSKQQISINSHKTASRLQVPNYIKRTEFATPFYID